MCGGESLNTHKFKYGSASDSTNISDIVSLKRGLSFWIQRT